MYQLIRNLLGGLMLICVPPVMAEDFVPRLNGDIGVGAFTSRSIIKGQSDVTSVLPYLDFKYSRWFARVDTFGYRMQEMGYGHLALIARFTRDGFDTQVPALSGIERRENSVPLGVGTLQITPIGGFLINVFHDINRSQGEFAELIYGGKIDLQRVRLYPLLGFEYQTGAYLRYYYGVSPSEAARSGFAAYEPMATVNSLAGMIAEVSIDSDYSLNLHFRRKWLGDAIQRSPLVESSTRDIFYIALSKKFN